MNIVMDDRLLREAMKATGLLSGRAVVEDGLRLLIRVKGQEPIRRRRGKVPFEGKVRKQEKGEMS